MRYPSDNELSKNIIYVNPLETYLVEVANAVTRLEATLLSLDERITKLEECNCHE